jgi:hypothetical protein
MIPKTETGILLRRARNSGERKRACAESRQRHAKMRFLLLPPCFPELGYGTGEAKSAPEGAS